MKLYKATIFKVNTSTITAIIAGTNTENATDEAKRIGDLFTNSEGWESRPTQFVIENLVEITEDEARSLVSQPD